MKKLIISIFALVLLVGCGEGPPSLEDRIADTSGDGVQYSYNGVIEQLELDIYQQGTHQLRTDEELLIVQSQEHDLNKYLEKRVLIEGVEAERIGNAERVLNIIEIELEDGEMTDEQEDYESMLHGFRFSYPSVWELDVEAGDIVLSKGDDIWVRIETFNDESDLDYFANSKEDEAGTPVTIASQRSLRYTKGSTIKMYVPNPPKKKVYLIMFNEGKNDVDIEKEYFYSLLENLEIIYLSVQKGDKCGGEDDIKCEEGYICELSSGEDDAEGICVSRDEDNSDLNCPFIASPTGCNDFRISEYSKNGCPARYECVDDEDSEDEEDIAFDKNALIDTIEKYQDQILSVDDATILQYEITQSKNLVAVVYEVEELSYKKLYSYSPSADEFNFIEKAYFLEGEDRDWEKESGEDLQADLNKIIVKASTTSDDGDVREVSSDMRLYENSHKDFSLEYPRNWYYRSFGAINNTRWIVGFGDDDVEVLSDAVIYVSILDEEPEDSDEEYFTVRDRDDDSVYVVEGPEDMKETIDSMADSIQ